MLVNHFYTITDVTNKWAVPLHTVGHYCIIRDVREAGDQPYHSRDICVPLKPLLLLPWAHAMGGGEGGGKVIGCVRIIYICYVCPKNYKSQQVHTLISLEKTSKYAWFQILVTSNSAVASC